jgi:hypothetical protein
MKGDQLSELLGQDLMKEKKGFLYKNLGSGQHVVGHSIEPNVTREYYQTETMWHLEIVCPYFLQVPGTCWGVPLEPAPLPPGRARCPFFGKKRGGTWVPPHSLKNACRVG